MTSRSCALLLALSGCGEESPTFTDAPPPTDAPSPDAPSPDAPSPDAPPVDAEPPRLCARITVSAAGAQSSALSYFGGSDGVHRYVATDAAVVAFQSEGSFAPEDTDALQDIYVRDRSAGVTTRVSVSSAGQSAGTRSVGLAISADGRFIAFHSASGTLVPGDTNGVEDVFVHDRVAHTTERVSVSSDESQSNCGSFRPSLSADGRYVAFDSCATGWTEVPGKTFPVQDVFVRDRLAGTTVLASRHPLDPSASGWDHHSTDPVLSADGTKVAFASRSSTIADKNGASTSSEIYVHVLTTGANEWISRHTVVAGQAVDSFHPSLSGDGRFVAYESDAVTQAVGDANLDRDIFVRDRMANTTERVNVSTAGAEAQEVGTTTGQGSMTATISDDGRYVAFSSYATNLVAGDTNATRDIFLRDRMLGVTTRVTGDAGAQPDAASEGPSMSGDGRWIAFVSGATNIVVPDGNAMTSDFYVCPVN